MLKPPAIRQLEVRCCCDPALLLGWILLYDPTLDLHPGARVKFRTRGPVLLGDLLENFGVFEQFDVELEVGQVCTAVGGPHGPGQCLTRLAFKSNELPLETLKRIPGFFPNELL